MSEASNLRQSAPTRSRICLACSFTACCSRCFRLASAASQGVGRITIRWFGHEAGDESKPPTSAPLSKHSPRSTVVAGWAAVEVLTLFSSDDSKPPPLDAADLAGTARGSGAENVPETAASRALRAASAVENASTSSTDSFLRLEAVSGSAAAAAWGNLAFCEAEALGTDALGRVEHSTTAAAGGTGAGRRACARSGIGIVHPAGRS